MSEIERESVTKKSVLDRLPGSSWLIMMLIIHAVLAGIYWDYTPYGAPPDEEAHGQYVHVLVEKHRLTNFTGYAGDGYEAHQPPLYYVMAMPFLIAGRALGMDQPGEMVRLLSLLLGALSVTVIYFAVQTAFSGDKQMALRCAAFAAFLPTHTMVSSSVSNTVLVEVLFGLTFLLAADALVKGPSWRKTVMLGLVVGAGLLTNGTCLILFGVALLTYALLWRHGRLSLGAAGKHMLAVIIVGAMIGGWWLVRNQVRYGDPLAGAMFCKVFRNLPGPVLFFAEGWSLQVYVRTVILWTFTSFWGCFGHMNVWMPAWTHLALALVTITVSIGFVVRLARRKLPLDGSVAIVYGVTLLAVVTALAFFNTKWLQAQGRYLYPALVPISVFWVLGIGRFAPRNELLRTFLVVSVPLAVQVVAIATCIVPIMPYYY